ncbi:HWE histidine kinase domain-containing protein [uncultured Erythrobacter sp.]|uniref:HWE histidine kinase domain-containing protein n=1 Tax=uncultured Erythrobacter sp. TaxID=263913 RepID=UPI0026303723|nr:HWE histidine kinase domain-containing protein [uncultured Erythrobacter sp.]
MNALFEYEQYMPHGMCLLWEPWLVLLWSGSDLMIFSAYMAIPMALILVLRRRPDLAHRGLVTMAASFVLLCGITHALSIVTLWYAIYPFMGALKLATGVISLITAVVLFRLIPVLVRVPTPDKHEAVIEQLESAMADLSRTRDELDARVKERTAELNRANANLAFTARDAVQRSRNLIQIVSSLTRPGAEVGPHPDTFLRELRGRINALAIATSTVMEKGDHARASIDRVIRRQVEPLFAKPSLQFVTDGPDMEIGAQGAQQISLAAWELASRFAQMGRFDQDSTRIEVSWSIEREADEPAKFVLDWRETLTPLTEVGEVQEALEEALEDNNPITRTPDPLPEFSEALLTRIIPHLLNGQGRIDVAGSVFSYKLTCTLDALDNSREFASGLDDERMIERNLVADL